MSIVDRRHAGAVCVVLALIGLLWPSLGRAERARFLRLGAGVAIPHEARVNATTYFPDGRASRTVGSGAGPHVALTTGVWFQPERWVGIAAAASYQRHDGDGARFEHISASILVIARRTLGDGLDVEVGLGPTAVFTVADIDFQPDLTRAFDGVGTANGIDARVGVTWRLSLRTFAGFEYRYVHHDIDIETQTAEWILGLPPRPKEAIRTGVNTHSLALGVGLRF